MNFIIITYFIDIRFKVEFLSISRPLAVISICFRSSNFDKGLNYSFRQKESYFKQEYASEVFNFDLCKPQKFVVEVLKLISTIKIAIRVN